jgi:Virulence-associated protein E-like domain
VAPRPDGTPRPAADADERPDGGDKEPYGYQGAQAEIDAIEDALEAVTTEAGDSVLRALHAYFPDGCAGPAVGVIRQWAIRSRPNTPSRDDVTPDDFIEAWRRLRAENPPRVLQHGDGAFSFLPAARRPTLSELLSELHRIAREAGSPISLWPDHKVMRDASGRATAYVPIAKSKANIATVLKHLGITVYWDDFARDFMVTGLKNYRRLDDHAVRALWFKAMSLGLHTEQGFFVEAVKDIARGDTRNPLKAYLDKVEAEYRGRVAKRGEPAVGKALIECLLIWYAGADDTPLNRAFVRKWLIAAVRRARKPGTKFDQMLVLESPEGKGKSMLPRRLASPEWFEENLGFGVSPRKMIQQTAGKWIVEMAELVAIGVKEIEAIKQQLSRTTDRDDLKYDRFATEGLRHFVFIGTTNDSSYLRSKTGNRRFWPIKITKEISEKKIAAIRDRLWGEAAYFEAQGESIELPRELWAAATEAQQEREIVDPLLEMLEPKLADAYGRISLNAVWQLAGYDPDARERKDNGTRIRLGLAMNQLGFEYIRKSKRDVKPGPDGQADIDIDVQPGARAVQGTPASVVAGHSKRVEAAEQAALINGAALG